jgi:hypothetical protein
MHPLVFLTWLVTSIPGEAQAPARDASTPSHPRTLSEFLLIRKNGDRIEGRSGSLTATQVTGISVDGQRLDILRDDIHALYSKEGSQAQAMALCGAGVGLVFSGSVLLRLSNESPHFFDSSNNINASLAFMGGSTVLGALIGLAVGSGVSTWRVEPLVAPGQQYSVHLALSL